MAGINKVLLIGNLGQNPEISYAQSGLAICKFSIATSRLWKDKTGTKKEETEWHNVTAFDKLAEICAEYLKKGAKAYVEGRLKTDKYDKDGQTHYATKIIAENVQFLDGIKKQEEDVSTKSKEDDVPF